MSYITNSEEVSDAIKLLGLDAKQISLEKKSVVFEKVIKKFIKNNKYYYPLWENMHYSKGIRYQFAWKLFSKMLKGKEVVLFFDFDDDKNMFLFVDGGVLTDVFANCFRFTFYITNIENTFLLAYNDHDYLIASGEAIRWIEDMELL